MNENKYYPLLEDLFGNMGLHYPGYIYNWHVSDSFKCSFLKVVLPKDLLHKIRNLKYDT